MENQLSELILPEGMLDHFDIEKIEQVTEGQNEKYIHIHLSEKNQLPGGYNPQQYESIAKERNGCKVPKFTIYTSAFTYHSNRLNSGNFNIWYDLTLNDDRSLSINFGFIHSYGQIVNHNFFGKKRLKKVQLL